MDWFYICYLIIFSSLFLLLPVSLPTLLMTTDNLFLAYNTLAHRLAQRPVLFYKTTSYVDRYVFYGLIMLCNMILPLLLYHVWWWISYSLYLLAMPCVMQHIMQWMSPWFMWFYQRIHACWTFLLYHGIAYGMNHLCLTTLQFHPHMTLLDVESIMLTSDIDKVSTLFKNWIILIVMKSMTNVMSFNMIKTFYNMKADYQYHDPYPHILCDDDKIKMMIRRRQYHLLLNPYVINLIIKLYEKKQLNTIVPVVQHWMHQLEKASMKACAILTVCHLMDICSILHYCIPIAIVSMCFVKQVTWQHLFIRLVSVSMALLFNSYVVGVLLSEFSHLMLNQVTMWLVQQATKWFKDNKHMLTHFNQHNAMICYHIGYLLLCGLTCQTMTWYHVVFIMMMTKQPILSGWFFMLGYLSNYHMMHLLWLALFYYVGVNWYYRDLARRPAIRVDKINNYKPPMKLLEYKAPKVHQPMKKIIVTDDYKKEQWTTTCAVLLSMCNPNYVVEPKK